MDNLPKSTGTNYVSNTEETIDKWETTLRLIATINKMDYDTTKGFIERTLVNSTLRFEEHLRN